MPAEGQQLARQAGRALGRAHDLLGVAQRRRSGVEPVPDELAVADDRGEQVVEIVRDAARQPADSLHLLGLPELLGQSALLAHVLQRHDRAHAAALRIHHRAPRHQRPPRPLSARDDDDLRLLHLVPPQDPLEREVLASDRSDAIGPVELEVLAGELAHRHLGRDPVNLARGAIEYGQRPFRIAGDQAGLDAVEHGAEELLLAGQGLLGGVAGAALLGLLERPQHGGSQAGQPLLEHVVGRSGPETFDRGLFPDRARNQDEGRVGRHLERDPQRGQTGEARQREVGENDVELVRLERRHERGPRGHGLDPAAEPLLLERRLDQRGVLGAILQVEDVPWRGRGVGPRLHRAPSLRLLFARSRHVPPPVRTAA